MDTKPHNPHNESSHGSDYVPTPEEIAVGYELRDTHLKPVLIFVVVFAITVAASFFVVIGVESGLEKVEAIENRSVPAVHPLSTLPNLPLVIPPGPLLEPSIHHDKMPQQDLAELQDQFKKTLSSYGWVDKDKKFARIPLESAESWVIEHGLPTKLAATQPSVPMGQPPASAQHGPGGIP